MLSFTDLAEVNAVWEQSTDVLNSNEDELEELDMENWAEEDMDEEEAAAFIAVFPPEFGEGYVSELNDGPEIAESLSTAALFHGMINTTDTISGDTPSALATVSPNPESPVLFDGLRIDTGANRFSVMSSDKYDAYCKEFFVTPRIVRKEGREVNGIGGKSVAIGATIIEVPFRDLGIVIDVRFLIISSDVPTLLSMRDMVDNKLDTSVQERTISLGSKKQSLSMENYFLIHRWSKGNMPFVLLTEVELRKIHSAFGHPSVAAMGNLLKRAGDDLSSETQESIKRLTETFFPCKRNSKRPRRFKLSVGTEDLCFNHSVQVDTMFLEGKLVLHLVDEATHFTAAGFLPDQSTETVWRTIQRLWICTYLGPPDYLLIEQGSDYTSKKMRENAEGSVISLVEAPIESPTSIGLVERYHAPLRVA